MTQGFIPDGEQDTLGRTILMQASIGVGAGVAVQVANETGRVLTLVGANGSCSAVAGAPTVDVALNGIGSMLAAPIALVPAVAVPGVVGAVNQVPPAGLVDFIFTGAAGDLDLQATATFTVGM